MYGHKFNKSTEQPGKVAIPARGELDREMNISLSAFVPEHLISLDEFGSPVPCQSVLLRTLLAESGAYLRDSSRVPRRRRPFIYLKPPYAIGSVTSYSDEESI